jgi:hypothetical protein
MPPDATHSMSDRDDGAVGAKDGVGPKAFAQALQGTLAKFAPNALLCRPVEEHDARASGLVCDTTVVEQALDREGADTALLHANARVGGARKRKILGRHGGLQDSSGTPPS